MTNQAARSSCPISSSLEIFGDTWSLLILRDVMFAGKRRFRELLQSPERISTNVLADRLRSLTRNGILTKARDPTHKQKAIYSLTERGIALLPVIAQIAIWGHRNTAVRRPVDARARALVRTLERGGPALWNRLMSDLRATHLSGDKHRG